MSSSSSWVPVATMLPVAEIEDTVGERDRRQPVRDDDRRHVELLAQRGEDPRLHRRVDGRGRVVEDQQTRAAHERAGQRDPLALTARERHPALADDGVVAVGKRVDEPRRPARSRSGAATLAPRSRRSRG